MVTTTKRSLPPQSTLFQAISWAVSLGSPSPGSAPQPWVSPASHSKATQPSQPTPTACPAPTYRLVSSYPTPPSHSWAPEEQSAPFSSYSWPSLPPHPQNSSPYPPSSLMISTKRILILKPWVRNSFTCLMLWSLVLGYSWLPSRSGCIMPVSPWDIYMS